MRRLLLRAFRLRVAFGVIRRAVNDGIAKRNTPAPGQVARTAFLDARAQLENRRAITRFAGRWTTGPVSGMRCLVRAAGTRAGGLLLLGTLMLAWPVEASAHKVCLDFALGEDLRDASRAGGSMNSCSGQTACPLDELCHCPSASCSCTGDKVRDPRP